MATRVGFQVLAGAVGEVDQENERFSAYYERVLLFFEASGIDAAKHVPMFLSLLGAKTHSLERDLVLQTLLQKKSLEELGRVLKTQFETTPCHCSSFSLLSLE